MRLGTLFSGIGAPECAWHRLGWQSQWCAEIEKFPSAVLAHRFPGVPNLGDVTKADWSNVSAIDVLCAGSPCQSFSIAGKRLGLGDPRGNLALLTLAIARQVKPRWLVFENVPGLLSSDAGRDFGAFLGLLGECGYGFAYRILDAQYFGVPQRRRRVFVVGHLGDWRRAAAVLFERESLQGHPAPRRGPREGVAGTLGAGAARGGGDQGPDAAAAGHLIPLGLGEDGQLARSLDAPHTASGRMDVSVDTFVAHSVAVRGREGGAMIELGDDVAGALRTGGGGSDKPHVFAFGAKGAGLDTVEDLSPTLRAGGHRGDANDNGGVMPAAMTAGGVRRLTPRECERLQGFPDDWTLVPFRGKAAADGPRYRAVGNSMAVPVLEWIGRRLALADAL